MAWTSGRASLPERPRAPAAAVPGARRPATADAQSGHRWPFGWCEARRRRHQPSTAKGDAGECPQGGAPWENGQPDRARRQDGVSSPVKGPRQPQPQHLSKAVSQSLVLAHSPTAGRWRCRLGAWTRDRFGTQEASEGESASVTRGAWRRTGCVVEWFGRWSCVPPSPRAARSAPRSSSVPSAAWRTMPLRHGLHERRTRVLALAAGTPAARGRNPKRYPPWQKIRSRQQKSTPPECSRRPRSSMAPLPGQKGGSDTGPPSAGSKCRVLVERVCSSGSHHCLGVTDGPTQPPQRHECRGDLVGSPALVRYASATPRLERYS